MTLTFVGGDRDDYPESEEQDCGDNGGNRRDHVPNDDIEEKPDNTDHRDAERGKAAAGGNRGGTDQPVALPVPEQDAVKRHRAHQESGGDHGRAENAYVKDVASPGEVVEDGGERNRQQETRQDLYAGLGHPQLLEQFIPVPVQPFIGGFVGMFASVSHGITVTVRRYDRNGHFFSNTCFFVLQIGASGGNANSTCGAQAVV